MKRILGIGNALVDILFPLKNDDLLTQLGYAKGSMNLIDGQQLLAIECLLAQENMEIRSGGSVANTIYGLASLGIPSGYIGKTGNDDMGEHFRQQLQQAGAELPNIAPAIDTPTGRCFVFISPGGERTFATYLGAALKLSASDLQPHFFHGYDLLHIEGYLLQNIELVDKAIELAKQASLQISIDLASYNVVAANLDLIRKLCREHVDIVFANEDEGKTFSGQESDEQVMAYLSRHAHMAVLKLGARGSRVKADHDMAKISAPIIEVIDTTGAGDIFASGFLAGYASGQAIKSCLEWGTALASELITMIGARLPKSSIDRYKQSWGL